MSKENSSKLKQTDIKVQSYLIKIGAFNFLRKAHSVDFSREHLRYYTQNPYISSILILTKSQVPSSNLNLSQKHQHYFKHHILPRTQHFRESRMLQSLSQKRELMWNPNQAPKLASSFIYVIKILQHTNKNFLHYVQYF